MIGRISSNPQAECVEETVIRIVGDHLGIPSATLKGTTHILQDLGADSLDLVELVITVEERFNITIGEEAIQKIQRIDDLIHVVASQISEHQNGASVTANPVADKQKKDTT